MKRAICLLTALSVLLIVAAPMAGQMSREQIESAIDSGVQTLVASQADDGHWPYAREAGYSVGHTALAVLALQHARSKRADAQLALKKGMAYILQSAPEPRTYSSGLALQSLYSDSHSKHRKLVAAYAWMLCSGQKLIKPNHGSWNYVLPPCREGWSVRGLGPLGVNPEDWSRTDNSNTQFAILGLVYAQKAGYQVPRIVWERATDYYNRIQHSDGAWDYQSDAFRAAVPNAMPRGRDSMSMTLVGTVSTYLCEEALADKRHRQCVARPPNKAHEAGLKWIGENWSSSQGPYGWYATERLGILIGYSEFGGHDWFQEGASNLTRRGTSTVANTAFKVLFLSRGRNPIIINKLKREGDWNLHRYDMKNLIEHVSGPWQRPSQWRIVTLDASVDLLLKVPILWISGHDRLKFTDGEKQKLKEYVERGGTILGEACCGKASFNVSFRELLKELWPDTELRALPKTHAIYTSFRKLAQKPTLMGLPLEKGQGRLGVIYIPYGMSCKWEVSGPGAQPWLDVGACIYLYIDQINRGMGSKD